MKKIIKKSLSLSLALVMLLAVFASTSVFAQGGIEKKVTSDLTFTDAGTNSTVSGTLNLSNTISYEDLTLKAGTDNTYQGKVKGDVEAGDLFSDVYALYMKELYNKKTLIWYWRNLVMFGITDSTFPSATYTVEFPENIFVDKENVKAITNTSTVSKIDVKAEEHSVEFTFYLGNWNDYEGFFKLVEKELNESGHNINIDIPYTVQVNEDSPENLGSISGKGECKLYKHGRFPRKDPIVSITAEEISHDVINPINK